MKRRVMGSLMAVLMSSSTVFSACPAPIFAAQNVAVNEQEVFSDATEVNGNNYGLVSVTEGNILHAWDWKFTDVTNNIEDIAKAGYSSVQVSPCQSCESFTKNNDWWKSYQPYDYKFGSVYGSEEEFKTMCDTAEQYGVNIIVDIVPNHIASEDQSKGYSLKDGVDSFWKNNINEYFHNTGNEFKLDTDRISMVRDSIGVRDVNTENETVQKRLVEYMEEMIAKGADGFRVDAAKHIGTSGESGNAQSSFWVNTIGVVKKKHPDLLYYGEVLNALPSGVSTKLYVNDGIKITETTIGWLYKDVFRKPKQVTNSLFEYVRSSDGVKNSEMINWVENHDTYLNNWGGTGLIGGTNMKNESNYMTNEEIVLAWASLASREGTQSLFFARPDGCSRNGSVMTIDGNVGISTKDSTWKDAKVAAVNKFKNAMVGESENCTAENNVAIIKRGNKGVVVTNYNGNTQSVKVTGLTGIADGTYKDAVSGKEIRVAGGNATISVDGKSIVVLYDENGGVTETSTPTPSNPASTTPSNPTTTTPADDKVAVSVSQEDTTFTDAFEVTITATNAAKAYYSYDGAEWKEFDGTTKVTVGDEELKNGDQVGLYVCAYDKAGTAEEKTYTYTKEVEGTVGSGFLVRVKKSDFAEAPNIYVYDDKHAGDNSYTGAWPGATMEEDGDYWIYSNDEITTASVIINKNGGSEKWPAGDNETPGFTVSNPSEFSLTTKEMTTITEAPEQGDKKPGKAPEAPAFEGEQTDTPSTSPSTEPSTSPSTSPSTDPAVTSGATVTATPTAEPEELAISTSVKDGTSFDTETMDVEVTLQGATEGTYSVDNGPEISFKDKATVTIGQGKIADREVTLKVKATNGTDPKEQTFTYKKVFNKEKAEKEQYAVKTSAVARIQSIFEMVAEAAEVATAAEADAYYATNPSSKVGKEATITSMSDFTEDMLVAQCGAWDVPNAFHGAHENSVADCYGLYAAWDNSNLYIGLEMVNTTDTWAAGGDGPLSDGGKMSDVPVVIAINTGKGNAMTGKCPEDKTGHIWQCNLEFKTRVDHLLFASAKGTGNPGLFTADADGNSDYKEHLVGFKDAGITYTIEDGSISEKIMHIKGPSAITDAYDISKYEDAMTAEKKHDRAYDTFYTYTIPLAALNIDKSYIESNGIGIMGLGTRQTSALDCIPHDPSMLDNSMEDYTLATDNTSYEKEDLDTITVPLAAVGNMNASGEGAGGTVITPPSKSPEVSTTPEAGETDDPTKTPEAGETDDPTKTPEVGETDNPDKTPEASTTPEPGTTSGSAVTDGGVSTKMVVNFGAEKSSPQLAAKTLKLEAEGHNGTGEYTYEFAIDDTVVQEASKTATYEWNPTKGTHTIQVTMTDENGNKVVSKKSYNIVGDGEDIVEPTDEVPTTSNPAEVTPTPSDNSTPEPSENVTTTPEGTTSTPTVTPDNTVTEVPSVDNTVTATPDPAGANTTATPEPAATNATATPVPATDATATPAPQQQLALKLKLSKAAPQKVGTSISIEANAAGGTGAYTYRYTVSLDNGYTKVLANNTDKNTVTWQPTKAGIYTISVVVMDTAGARVEKTAKYQITASKLAITKVKVNKKTIKVKKNVKFTVSGTAKSGKLKVQFTVTKSGKVVATRKYATKKTFTWKPKTKGTYKLLIQAKDGSGKVVKKTVKVTVK